MWLAGASYWLVGAPTSLLLGFTFGMQGFGIWLGLAVGLLVAAITLTARFVILSNKPLQREE
jgi:MATE family multidrug resistance protein